MSSINIRPKTVTEYIQMAPKETRARLRDMRRIIHSVDPKAVEGLKWGMPAFSRKRILVAFAVFERHIGFYPTPSAVRTFAKDLVKYHTAKGSIQFPHNKILPLSLIRRITRFRVKESIDHDRKWRSK